MGGIQYKINFSGSHLDELFRSIVGGNPFCQAHPDSLEVDFETCHAGSDWVETVLAKCKQQIQARWSGQVQMRVGYYTEKTVEIGIPGFKDIPTLINWLSQFDFELASFNSLYTEWLDIDEEYTAPIMGSRQHPHGWACAFKGRGHDYLVSRRWLEFGPWKCHHGPQDITIIQFHDLSADAVMSLKQAKPGHERLGPSDIGGFIQDNYFYDFGIKGSYNADKKMLRIIVHGRDIPQKEMLDMCAARRFQALGQEQPLERIAYVFMEEEHARKYLQELWLRELECWAIIDGEEERLDSGFQPSSTVPEWV